MTDQSILHANLFRDAQGILDQRLDAPGTLDGRRVQDGLSELQTAAEEFAAPWYREYRDAYSGDREHRFRSIVTGGAACGVAHLNCRVVVHDGSELGSFLMDFGF